MAHTHKHHTISPRMHYTVMLALVISLITTFCLGLLLTDALWGGGLGYFHDIQRKAQVAESKARLMQYINYQVNEQLRVREAQASIIIEQE